MDLRAVIFVPALVAAAICVFCFLTFAAHYYLTVLEGTAAGAKRITWFSEPITDNFGKPFYLAWLLCLWLGPAYIIGRSLAAKAGTPWLALGLPVFVAWALYPVSQLSSLSASSVWIPLHPQVFARLVQKPAVTLGFYLLTLPLFALAGLAFKWSFLTEGQWDLLFAGVPLLVFAGFMYARLLGRLAFALMFTRDLLKRRKKKKPKPKPDRKPEPDEEDESEEEPTPTAVQPSEMPPIQTPEGELAGYDILVSDDPPRPKKRVVAEVAEEDEPEPVLNLEEEPAPAPPPKRTPSHNPAHVWTDEDDDATPYTAREAETVPEEHAATKVVKPSAEEMELLERSDAPKPPKVVWNAEVFAFLSQPGTISAMIVLAGIATLAGASVRVARMFNPVAGSE
jgi:hypothetical protein